MSHHLTRRTFQRSVTKQQIAHLGWLDSAVRRASHDAVIDRAGGLQAACRGYRVSFAPPTKGS